MPSGHFMCMALRLRKIPARRSGCSRGRVEVRFGGHPGTKSRPNRHQAGPFRSPRTVLVVQVAQEAVQEAQQNRTATRTKRYAQRGPADMCARHHMKHNIFEASSKAAKTLAEGGRAKRYAQCHFVDMNAFKSIMAQERVNFFGYLAKLNRVALT